MRKFFSKVKDSALFYFILIFILFIITNFILIINDIQFRKWVYYVMIALLIISIIFDKVKNESEKLANLIIGIIVLISCETIIILCTYKKEYVVVKDEKKYVAYVQSFFEVEVEYYDYINPFLVGSNLRIREEYGESGYPPFDEKYIGTEPIKTNYYQDDKYFK